MLSEPTLLICYYVVLGLGSIVIISEFMRYVTNLNKVIFVTIAIVGLLMLAATIFRHTVQVIITNSVIMVIISILSIIL